MNPWLLILPFISALIGWLLQRMMVRLLFHPVKPIRFLGITIRGIFPAKQNQIAGQVASIAANQFASLDLERKIADPKSIEKIMPVIEKHIDEFLRVKLGKEMPIISAFIGDKTVESLKKIFMKELSTLFPEVMKNYAGNLKKDLNIEAKIKDRIIAMDASQVETAMQTHLSKEIKYFEFAGAIIGVIIGLVQLALTIVIF